MTLADDAGKVTRISKSSAGGGINRSPFLTALFIKIVRAFGAERILKQIKNSSHFHSIKFDETIQSTELRKEKGITNFTNLPFNQLQNQVPALWIRA